MPIESKPASPVQKGYHPQGYRIHHVKATESFETVAKHYGLETWELIYENFKTRKEAEVNWYLRNYVGCKNITSDGHNYIFSDDDQPGVIYVPTGREVMPPKLEKLADNKLKKVWAGLAKAHSGDLFVVGAHDMTGMIYNLGDSIPDVRNAVININGYKLGAGLGASVGAVLVIAHGYSEAPEFNGVSGGWDFDVSIGAKLGDVLKGVKGIGKVVDTIDKFKKLRYVTETAIKNIGITKPGVYSIPIPFAGAGLHLWGGFKFGDVKVLRQGKGIY